MKIISLIICLFLLLPNSVMAARERLLDDKDVCERYKGVWREFGNGCADNCHDSKTFLGLCAQTIVYACDCGKNKCWDYNRCISNRKFQKMVDDQREKRRLEAERLRMEEELKLERQRLSDKVQEDLMSEQEVQSPPIPPVPFQ